MYKLIKKLIKKYLVPLIILFFIANTSIALLIFSKASSNDCMTQAEIDADNRCLYVYQNNVYEKGSRNHPHKGHDCGINVDEIMPNLHFVGNVLTKFDNSKVAPFCTSVAPTQTPTQAPTSTPTVTPTANPTATPTASGQATATAKPTATALGTLVPTAEPTSTATATQNPTSQSFSGNDFGEILGKPTKTSLPVVTEQKFDLTKISKPITYISLLGLIGSIVLLFF